MLKGFFILSSIFIFTKLYGQSDNVNFRFKAYYVNKEIETVEISGYLRNNNLDTVYFVTVGCDCGEYLLHYDTTNFTFIPFLSCSARFPKVEAIAPNTEIKFRAHFMYKLKDKKIKLGFDFYQVDKMFDITKFKFDDVFKKNMVAGNLKWYEESIQ